MTFMNRIALAWCLAAALPAVTHAQERLEVKWVRDSEEYATLTRQVYRQATRAVEAAARQVPRNTPWAVVLDLDETTLDNSVYQLERTAYGNLPFDTASWNAWTWRRESDVVPGVQDFIAAVRRLGGRVAWITNRGEMSADATRENLARFGLWLANDRLCLHRDAQYGKPVRRAEVTSGTGACGWTGEPVRVLVFVGDQLGDFPDAGEADPDAGKDAAFGARYFLLPQPMYGAWTNRVTRRR